MDGERRRAIEIKRRNGGAVAGDDSNKSTVPVRNPPPLLLPPLLLLDFDPAFALPSIFKINPCIIGQISKFSLPVHGTGSIAVQPSMNHVVYDFVYPHYS